MTNVADIRPVTLTGSIALESRWVAWREEPGKTGRLTKVPYKLDGGKAATDNPDTWATRAVAERAANRLRERSGPGAKVGIGMVLGERGKLASTPLAGLDLDSCFDEEGHTQPWA